MNSTHTAQSLKYYIGTNVFDNEDSIEMDYLLSGVDGDMIRLDGGEWIDIDAQEIYPILKTAESMTDNDFKQIYGESKRRRTMDINFKIDFFEDGRPSLAPFLIPDLLELGYGAIPNKESETGYVDLFGMPCVTPDMVEKKL